MRKCGIYLLIVLMCCFSMLGCKSTQDDKNEKEKEENVSNGDQVADLGDMQENEKELGNDNADDVVESDVNEVPEETNKFKETESDKKIQNLVEKYRGNFEAISEEEYLEITGWVGYYNGYFVNEEGTVTISITNYSDFYGGFSFGIGGVNVYGYEIRGEWEICGENKAKLVGLIGWEERSDSYYDSGLSLIFNQVIVDFSDYEKDNSITVKVNDGLEYKCTKVINYFQA